jgi:hypothetical protein
MTKSEIILYGIRKTIEIDNICILSTNVKFSNTQMEIQEFYEYTTLQYKHNVHTLSENIKFIRIRRETEKTLSSCF